jgi:hypothetical protein
VLHQDCGFFLREEAVKTFTSTPLPGNDQESKQLNGKKKCENGLALKKNSALVTAERNWEVRLK